MSQQSFPFTDSDVADAFESAQDAFFVALADRFNARSGDFPPDADDAFRRAGMAAVRTWLEYNVVDYSHTRAAAVLAPHYPVGTMNTGGGIMAAEVPFGPSGHVWVTDGFAMEGEQRWTVGYYFAAGEGQNSFETEGIYRYPSTAEALLEAVEELATIHRQTLRVAYVLEQLDRNDPGTGVLLAMRDGGLVSGTLTGDVDNPTQVRVNVRRSKATPQGEHAGEYVEERSYELTEIRTVHVVR